MNNPFQNGIGSVFIKVLFGWGQLKRRIVFTWWSSFYIFLLGNVAIRYQKLQVQWRVSYDHAGDVRFSAQFPSGRNGRQKDLLHRLRTVGEPTSSQWQTLAKTKILRRQSIHWYLHLIQNFLKNYRFLRDQVQISEWDSEETQQIVSQWQRNPKVPLN